MSNQDPSVRPWVRKLIAKRLRWVVLALIALATPIYLWARIRPAVHAGWREMLDDFNAIRDFRE